MSGNRQKTWTAAEVADARDAADGVRAIRVRFPAPVSGPVEGAHVDVQVFVRGQTQTRSYSVTGRDPADASVITLGVRLAPDSRGGSRYMHGLSAGSRLRVTQPLVTFPFTVTGRPLRFLAGGIGITALMPMAAAAARRPPHGGYQLTYLGQARERMAFADELSALHGSGLEIRTSAEHGAFDARDYVKRCPRDAVLYLCGPAGLMEAVRTEWSADGRDLADCRFETFGTTGSYPAAAFAVSVPRLGLEVPVAADQSLLDALEEHGAEILSDCRKGGCGICRVPVLGTEGCVVDHRDVFLSADQKRAGTRICPCVSRAYPTTPGQAAVLVLDLP